MGRKKGRPVFKRKSRATSFICTREAWDKLRAAERRTGKSRSDVITHCLLQEADKITREMFDRLAQPSTAAVA